ncbi:CDP-glucose 4,6-dehydratase [Emcibacter sp. SYSU 3D8]|uniref:CDP-glucose 4,6-dehydratase n=1 Tax=Emcibacter sp. SYSU 3D8 TaxID=3133969 RepID=UPI0031FE7480
MSAFPQPSFWRGKRVLVTGHTGFKGGWLSLWLDRLGAEVAGYALPPDTDPSLFALCRIGEIAEHHVGDVRDPDALQRVMAAFRPDIVFHLAAQPLVRASYADPVGTYATNVMGTVNLLEAVRRTPSVTVAVVVTSDKCYAEDTGRLPYGEGDPMGGRDPYSSSKGAAELVTAAYAHSFLAARGCAVATVRAGNVLGGGDWAVDRLAADIMRGLLAGQEPVLRNPGAVRPWQHVLDPLRGYLLAAEHLARTRPTAPATWNFGPDAASEVTVREVAGMLCDLWGDGAKIQVAPQPDAPHEAHMLRLSSDKARRELGWTPALPLADALTETVAWFRACQRGDDMRAVSRGQIERHGGLAMKAAQ